MTTVTVAEMESRHHWFRRLDAEHRSWITLVAQAGIDGFVKWFASPEPRAPSTADIFGSAPRELARRISLYQTVELVRTTIDVVESQIDEVMPKADRPILHAAIIQYSREVAFSAAEVYARAAELRGAWDERLEALVVDAVLRGETDDTVLSRASTLGWHATASVVVVVGPAPDLEPALALESIRHTAAIAGTDMLGAVQGDRMVVVLGGAGLASEEHAQVVVGKFAHLFGPGAVVIGPPVEHLMDAAASTREALAGYRAAAGWPEAPRPVAADDLLPERALSGDGHARRALARSIYDPLVRRGWRAVGDPGDLPGPGPVGRGRRALAVRPRQHRPLPAPAHPRGHRLQPHRPAGRVRAPAGRHPGPAVRPGQERGDNRDLGTARLQSGAL